ncbi:hypothetical protein VTI74DRAFT_341 [Chaetomium olivicolor]
MRHSRTHHSRTSRNTHPRGCSGRRLATVCLTIASPTCIMQLAMHSRQSLGFGKGVWVGRLAGLAERTQEKKRRWAGRWCASRAAAGKSEKFAKRLRVVSRNQRLCWNSNAVHNKYG